MIEHILLAVVIQLIIWVILRSWSAGAAAAIAWFVSREITQAEYRWIEHFGAHHRANMPWWGGLDPRVWQYADPPMVAEAISGLPNDIRVRGHTDASQFAAGARNNWTLSGARADATRQHLMMSGIASKRFLRIEGVADREPYNPADPYDAVNRRISITLGWTRTPP